MFNLREIAARDAATYYDYASGGRHSRAWTLAGFAIMSLLIGFAVNKASDDFLAGALSVQAILVGFSFNVLFYLVANRLSKPAKFESIEHESRFERLAKLSDEVFDNVTYFNVVAIFSVLGALALLLVASDSFELTLHWIKERVCERTALDPKFFSCAKWFGQALGLSLLTFILIESVYTFLRAVGRVRFYFTMLKTMDDEVAAAGTN